MTNVITLKKGLDIKLCGAATGLASGSLVSVAPKSVAVVPDDFTGIVPRLDVKENDSVRAGQALFHDKDYPDIKVVSPVAGVVTAIERGERRKILRVVITPDFTVSPEAVDVAKTADRVLAERLLLDSGLWAYMRQRPYGIVPRPGVVPRDIIITGFDSAPLAPDYEPIAAASIDAIDAAVALLSTLTDGSVFLTMREGSSLAGVKGCKNYVVKGPHPAGNAGVQLGNIRPVNKGDMVWTLDLMTAIRIGRYLLTGVHEFDAVVALTGCQLETPCYVKTVMGADMATLLSGREAKDDIHHRVISGNVLTGTPVGPDGYLRFPYTQVSVIAEGDDKDEFMGWASLSLSKMSVNRSFPGHFGRSRSFCADARLLGGRRAMIMSGVYDKVLPMDIMVEYLIKACLSKNIERMEQLGIYEVVPEDVALCEYVDPSKLELQAILREALDYAYKELN